MSSRPGRLWPLRRNWPPGWPRSRRPACARIGRRSWSRRGSTRRRRWPTSSATAWPRSPPTPCPAPPASPLGRAATAPVSERKPPGYPNGMNFGEMKDKAGQFLDSDKGEKYSDEGLQKAEQFADERTGGKHDEQIQKAGQFADEHVGQRDAGADPEQPSG